MNDGLCDCPGQCARRAHWLSFRRKPESIPSPILAQFLIDVELLELEISH
jgi:hypothetical protein